MFVRSPSNIAWVKYMGKKSPKQGDLRKNIPENASLSLTLGGLSTWMWIERGSSSAQTSLSGILDSALEKKLTQTSLEKGVVLRGFYRPDQVELSRMQAFLNVQEGRLKALLDTFGLSHHPSLGEMRFLSANSFPASAGIASSASSFSALTFGAAANFCRDIEKFDQAVKSEKTFREGLALISAEGSGSSCRSFFPGFVYWDGERVQDLQAPWRDPIVHFVCVVDQSKKAVSSSEAHKRVKTSPLWEGRVVRANQRAFEMKQAIYSGDFSKIQTEAWQESLEMHSLFHTAEPSFFYWNGASIEILKALDKIRFRSDSAWFCATMDAGPNIHLTCLKKDAGIFRDLLQSFQPLELLEDVPGAGTEWVQD